MAWEIAAAGLTLAVVLVNGWTDAPNAIAGAVGTGALSMGRAAALAAAGNLAGAWFTACLGGQVARTVFGLADFGGDPASAAAGLCAALAAIVLWAVGAWRLGIPTSESHALAAGICGAALALGGGERLRPGPWLLVLAGLGGSLVLGMLGGWLTARVVRRLPGRRTAAARRFFRRSQVAGAAAMAFLHGAQDGQKFLGILLLVSSLGGGWQFPEDPRVPALVCAGVMAAGTAMGGGRIVRTVGQKMVGMEDWQGFSADLWGILCLGVSTWWGVPVSTTHTKTAALLGAAAAGEPPRVDWRIAGEMVVAWVLTFPACGLLAWALTKVFLGGAVG